MIRSADNKTWQPRLSLEPPASSKTASAVLLGPLRSSGLSRQTRQPLARLPQLLCQAVVPSFGSRRFQRAVGEVASAERLDALLQGAVQRGLGPPLRVQEEELGEGRHEEPRPRAHAATQFCEDDPWDGEKSQDVGLKTRT